MASWKGRLTALALFFLFVCAPGERFCAAGETCDQLLTSFEEHHAQMERELRRLHREIAMLRQEFENPGMEDIFSGIGYILGLFGVAFFVAGHRERQRE
ncbi:MAG: hypothetical protein AB7F20_00315 [Geoalkalibacter sp.]|jgi:nickel transport protein|uniref:hypothetical protein n=1 Tax=Geoalkalibacter sp. TaxID=3041440 RepID=UPI002A9AFD16|nr:hypothetical protein [Thermodesulfobacteriota bacterium]